MIDYAKVKSEYNEAERRLILVQKELNGMAVRVRPRLGFLGHDIHPEDMRKIRAIIEAHGLTNVDVRPSMIDPSVIVLGSGGATLDTERLLRDLEKRAEARLKDLFLKDPPFGTGRVSPTGRTMGYYKPDKVMADETSRHPVGPLLGVEVMTDNQVAGAIHREIANAEGNTPPMAYLQKFPKTLKALARMRKIMNKDHEAIEILEERNKNQATTIDRLSKENDKLRSDKSSGQAMTPEDVGHRLINCLRGSGNPWEPGTTLHTAFAEALNYKRSANQIAETTLRRVTDELKRALKGDYPDVNTYDAGSSEWNSIVGQVRDIIQASGYRRAVSECIRDLNRFMRGERWAHDSGSDEGKAWAKTIGDLGQHIAALERNSRKAARDEQANAVRRVLDGKD